MTTFLSNRVEVSRLTFQFVSSNDPDLICVEVVLDGNVLIDVSMDRDGQTNVSFDEDGGEMEFDLGELRSLLDKCETDLRDWRERLVAPGEIWSAPE